MKQPFVYKPLDHGTDSIRVFSILPDANSSIIRCRMWHTTISKAEHCCLSYTWQPRYPEREIEVNGCSLTVGENLYQFLRAFRASNNKPDAFTGTLWADAICIDQEEVKERNHQVSQMGGVYENARMVIIWLGVLEAAMLRFLDNMLSLVPACTVPNQWEIVPENMTFEVLFDLRIWRHKFWRLPYWKRIWIAQELMKPVTNEASQDNILIFTGNIFVSFQAMGDRCRWLGDRSTSNIISEIGEKYYRWRNHRFLMGDTSLPSLLQHFVHAECTDIRDRIFALLPFTESGPRPAVNYTIDAAALFRSTMQAFLPHLPLAELLSFGANLITALELSHQFTENDIMLERNDPSLLSSYRPARCLIPKPGTAQTTDLIWSIALVVEEGMNYPRLHHSAFLAFFNGDLLVLFEYIVTHRTRVQVLYARIHEFNLQPSKTTKSKLTKRKGKAEDSSLEYAAGPFDDDRRHQRDTLNQWISPMIEGQGFQITRQCSSRNRLGEPRLKLRLSSPTFVLLDRKWPLHFKTAVYRYMSV